MAQKLNSSLIRNYIAASQKIELEFEANRLARISNIGKTRGGEKKEESKDSSKDSSGKDSIKELDQHKVPWGVLCERYNIPEKTIFTTGLNKDDAAQRNLKEGDNVLSERVKTPWWMLLLHELTSAFALLLWAGAILCFIAYGLDSSDPSNLYLGIVLAIV